MTDIIINQLHAEIAAQASVIDALREEVRAAEEQIEFWKRRALRNAAYLRRIEQGEL